MPYPLRAHLVFGNKPLLQAHPALEKISRKRFPVDIGFDPADNFRGFARTTSSIAPSPRRSAIQRQVRVLGTGNKHNEFLSAPEQRDLCHPGRRALARNSMVWH